jgi:hypothetical protein
MVLSLLQPYVLRVLISIFVLVLVLVLYAISSSIAARILRGALVVMDIVVRLLLRQQR